MDIYHTIVTLKGGPLNVSQSNLATGTVHWILYRWPNNLSCVTRLPNCEVLESRSEDKADIAFGFFKVVSFIQGVRTSRGQPARLLRELQGNCWYWV